jgi:chaperonin cofactor prefoldin
VNKLLQYPKLIDKNRDLIQALEKKERELLKELETVRKQVTEGDARVRELSSIIQSELSTKLKAIVKISQ